MDDYVGIIAALVEIIDAHGIRSLDAEQSLLALNDARRIARQNKRAPKVDYDWWVKTWNDNCGDLPKLRGLSDRRRASIRAFTKQAGGNEAAQALLLDAVKFVAQDEWWQGKNPDGRKYGFDNLVPNKIFRKAEQWTAIQTIPNSEGPKFKPGQKVIVLGYLEGKAKRVGYAGVLVEFANGSEGNYRLDEVEPRE